MQNSPIMTVIVALVVGAVAFFGGMQYQKSRPPTNFTRRALTDGNFQRFNGQNGQNGQNTQIPGRMSGGRLIGEILTVDHNSITVKTPDGGSKIVILSDNTIYRKTAAGDKSDLKTGDSVGVFGATNSDGSVSATEVQINPVMRIGGNPNQ